jgi:hypothetical protein
VFVQSKACSLRYGAINLKYASVFVLELTLSLWFGCKHTSESIPQGAYAYTSYDSSGVELVSGWFTMIVSDSTTVSGEWHFSPIGSPQKIGPQTGDGKLVGGMNGEKVWIELNSGVRNNNLQLNGISAQSRIDGQWTWISYDGIANQGIFHAVRK